MKKIKRFLFLFPLILFSGCYTQLMLVEKREPPKEEVVWEIDSATGDTVKVIKRVDTVKTKEREICVWRRDLMGYPYLYCYESYYPRDWFYYNYSPWWYRNDPFWYDYYRCPRYYYYDQSCGCCKYSSGIRHREGSYYKNGGGSTFVPSEPSGSSYKSRVRGVPDDGARRGSNSAVESKADNSKGDQQEKGKVIISRDKKEPVIVKERVRGVPDGGERIENSNTKSSAEEVAPSPSSPQKEHTNLPPPPTGNSKSSSNSSNNDNSEDRRDTPSRIRNPRNW